MPSTTFSNTANLPTLSWTLPSGPMTIYHPGTRPTNYPASGAGAPGEPPPTAATASHVTVNSIPPGSGWAAPPHWHETHTEHFRVVRGFALVRLRHDVLVVGPGDGALEVPPYAIHGFGRADVPGPAADAAWRRRFEAGDGGGSNDGRKPGAAVDERDGAWREEDVLVEEWTSPADGRKEVFFRNSMSYYRDHLHPLIGAGGVGGGLGSMLLTLPGLLRQVLKMLFLISYMDNYMLILDNGLGVNSDGTASSLSWTIAHSLHSCVKVIGKLLGWRFWWEEYTPVELRSVCKAMEKQ